MQTITNHLFESKMLVVVPKTFRRQILALARDHLGHLGFRNVKNIIRKNFTWPSLNRDVIQYCRSYETCQCCSRSPAGKAPLITRQVMTEPFNKVMAFDLVGPFPKAKGGFRFLLTGICMATRWPEAIPLKTVTARAVANGMVEMFARTGLPLQLLTDQGSQFVGSLVKRLCKDLSIEKLQTAPYS